MTNHRNRRSRRGFTAIELLVAAGIGAVLLIIVGLAFNQVTTSVSLARARAECYQTFRAMAALIEQDLDGLVIDRTEPHGGINIIVRDPHNLRDVNGNLIYPDGDLELYRDTLRVRTASRFNASERGKTSYVEYGLREINARTWDEAAASAIGALAGPDDVVQHGWTLEMVRRVTALPRPHIPDYNPNAVANRPIEPLAPHVVGFRVDYWNEAQAQWVRGAPTPPAGLRLIRIRIDIVDSMGQILRNDRAPMTFIIEKDLDRPIGSGGGL